MGTTTAIVRDCFLCGRTVSSANLRMKFGQSYCSIACEDLGEERNQGHESICFELEEQES